MSLIKKIAMTGGLLAFGYFFLLPGKELLISTEDSPAKKSSVVYKEGIQYTTLKNPIDFPSNHVLSYFWYGCPHCYAAKKQLDPWVSERGDSVIFDERHSQLGASWVSDSQVYNTIKYLDLDMSYSDKYFDKRQEGLFPSNNVDAIISSIGLDVDDFKKGMSSSDVKNQMIENFTLEKKLKSQGVPSILVGGKYLVKLDGLKGDWGNLTRTIDYLISLGE